MEVDSDEDTRRSHASDDANDVAAIPPSDSDEDKDKDKKDAKKPKPKKTGPVKRMMLSEDIVIGKNGLVKLQEIFSDFQFKGKKHEKSDLDRLLHKLEHWTHTMHPRHPFDQSLERLEWLGTKRKIVKTHVKKIRMGFLSYADVPVDNDARLDFESSDDDEAVREHQLETHTNIENEHSPNINNEFPDDDDDDMFMASLPDVLSKEPESSTNINSDNGPIEKDALMEQEDDVLESVKEGPVSNVVANGSTKVVDDDEFDRLMAEAGL